MTKITHAAIVPLIGGELFGMMNALNGQPPEYILSYSPFVDNEKHLLNYLKNEGHDVPYYLLDTAPPRTIKKVTIMTSVCPCAGLSRLSRTASADNKTNQWMIKTAEYVLENIRPEVFWGENAPALATTSGKKVRDQLFEIGDKNGYSMSLYKTKSILHGLPQIRQRAFYFFWKGNQVPVFNDFKRPYQRIEDLIAGVKSNFQQELISDRIPSRDDPYYRYLLEVIHGGITHRQFFDQLGPGKTHDVMTYIEHAGHKYDQVAAWMRNNGYEREAVKCERRFEKLNAKGEIMRRATIIPKDHIGAFVGHYPTSVTHPYEDRYLSYREAMSIMGLPSNYELLDPKKSLNHICQNVPVTTAQDMANEVLQTLAGKRKKLAKSFHIQSNLGKPKTEINTLESYYA